ncbi:hypothetical protein AB0D08_35365 [Kitasatospora sp. NPDC048540]|uniref:hypothetical protein n=1 Tax=unclassified Kitasatospora TaxID=2633591 RepID=UPI0011EA6B78|nr:hypothetical protein [Kitasatospora sp. MBT63]
MAAAVLALEVLAAAFVQVGFASFAALDCDQAREDGQPSCAADGLYLGLWLLVVTFSLVVVRLWFRYERAPRRRVRVLMAWVVLVQIAVVGTLFDPVAQPVGGEWIEGAAVLAGCAYTATTALLTMVSPAPSAGAAG